MRTEELHRKETGQKTEGKEGEGKEKLDRLVKRGEWIRLKDNEEFRVMSLEGKISIAMETVNVRIGQMERVFYTLLPRHPKDAGIVLQHSIKPMRNLNDALAARLAGEFQQEDNTSEAVAFVLGVGKGKNQLVTLKKEV